MALIHQDFTSDGWIEQAANDPAAMIISSGMDEFEAFPLPATPCSIYNLDHGDMLSITFRGPYGDEPTSPVVFCSPVSLPCMSSPESIFGCQDLSSPMLSPYQYVQDPVQDPYDDPEGFFQAYGSDMLGGSDVLGDMDSYPSPPSSDIDCKQTTMSSDSLSYSRTALPIKPEWPDQSPVFMTPQIHQSVPFEQMIKMETDSSPDLVSHQSGNDEKAALDTPADQFARVCQGLDRDNTPNPIGRITSKQRRRKAAGAKERERKHKCVFGRCCQSFLYKGNLEAHVRVHTKEKPFDCRYCDKKFTQLANKLSHERVHEGFKDHRCRICGVAFSQSGNRNLHESTTHSNDRPFACFVEECGKAFKTKGSLKTHLNGVHKSFLLDMVKQARENPNGFTAERAQAFARLGSTTLKNLGQGLKGRGCGHFVAAIQAKPSETGNSEPSGLAGPG